MNVSTSWANVLNVMKEIYCSCTTLETGACICPVLGLFLCSVRYAVQSNRDASSQNHCRCSLYESNNEKAI